MEEAQFLLRGIAVGLLLGMTMTAWLRFRHYYPLRVLGLFGLCLCGYLLAPVLHDLGRGPLFYLAVVFSDASVLLFLLLVQALFDEHPGPALRSLWFGALYLGASYTELALEHGLGLDTRWLRAPIRLAMLGGALYSLYVVVRNWRQDLVESRRRMRLAVCGITGCYVIGVTLVESIMRDQPIPDWVELANTVGIIASILVFLGAALLMGEEGLLPPAPAPAGTPAAEPPADPELDRLLAAMGEEGAYREMDLTIRSLASRLGIAEHRLRKLINTRLDYRNFNDFLNHYRLQEVTRRLRDPAERQVPILTIAMDAGYRSMTTFNRAFRAENGTTPSDFRQQHCANPVKS